MNKIATWCVALGLGLMLSVGAAAPALAAGDIRNGNGMPATGSDVKRLLNDASYAGASGATGSDVKRLLNDASYAGASGATGSDVKRLLNDASYAGAAPRTGVEPVNKAATVATAAPGRPVEGFVIAMAILAALLVASVAANAAQYRGRLRQA